MTFFPRKTGIRTAAAAVILALCLEPLCVSAASKDTESKLNSARENRKQTENALDASEDVLDDLNEAKGSLESVLSGLDAQLAEAGQRLDEISDSIDSKNAEIDETTKDLDSASDRAKEQYAYMKKRIQYIYEQKDENPLTVLLESKSFTDMMNRQTLVDDLSAYDRRKLEEYRQTEEEIEQDRQQLEQELADLQELQQEAEEEKAKIGDSIAETSDSLSAYEDQIGEAEAKADQLQADLDRQNSEIRALEKQLAEERRLESMSKASVWRNVSDLSFAAGDRTLLANIIYCEAGGQPYEGQLAVGAVIINRVRSGAFPGTISGVVYQSGQFGPASSGRLALALARDDATDSCYQAADMAMAGQTNVGDCIFFRAPTSLVTPKYTIGNHIFY